MILSIFELDAKLVSKIKEYQSKDGSAISNLLKKVSPLERLSKNSTIKNPYNIVRAITTIVKLDAF